MPITSIPEDDAVTISENTRERSYSHARTNSSSSSASSFVYSPTNVGGTGTTTNNSNNTATKQPSQQTLRHQSSDGQLLFEDSESDGSSATTTTGTGHSSHKLQYQHSASEAAAVAAIRNTVNNVQISTSRPQVHEAQQKFQQLKQPQPQIQVQPSPQPPQQHFPNHHLQYQQQQQLQQQQQQQLQPQQSHHHHHHHGIPGSAKFSSVAASAAAFAAKPKESALSKAKMFAKQARPHLSSSSSAAQKESHSKRKNVDLTINTKQLPPSRPSLSERSPLARPSKELERIASIGSTNSGPVGSTGSRENEKQHKHHISFRSRKDTHGGVVLSSSSSNSKLISEGSIYSFHPSSPGLAAIDVKNLNTKEDRDQIAEESWTLLCSRVLPLFSGEGLRVPVEDLNNLVLMHLNFLIQQGGTAKDILNEFKTLLKAGMHNMDPSLASTSDERLIPRLVEVWSLFFSQVVPYLEGVFLPLQAEFEGMGQVLTAQSAKEYWSILLEKDGRLNTRRYILMAFRDHVLLPISDRLASLMTQAYTDFQKPTGSQVTGTMVRLLQCTNVMASIQSDDENQKCIDQLLRSLGSSGMGRRTGKDRRGFVLNTAKN